MATPDRAPRWDEQLQRRLARGEETALGEIYDQLAPMVHGLAGRILADQAAAAQLTREIFAHVWEHPEDFDPAQGSLRSWLGALTHRRAVDRLRARRAAERVPGGPGSGLDGPGGGEGAAEAEIRAVATAARMQYVVDSLPQSLRETIAVTYYDGRTYQETARLLGISEQAAKQRMRLGLELLATELAEERARHDERHGREDDRADDRDHRDDAGDRDDGDRGA
ncbi:MULTISPECIES: sigma-70 family RNA polymerase sigma factor [unclassified Kitasatospora]|uniref:sigma-70 family RNA polymerase sigma factor n=1 Tax=unclassified Kitasatospora TaxID=2633591 RepID=UPI00341957FA